MTKPKQQQIFTFLVGCIGTRIALSIIAKKSSGNNLQYIGLFASIISLSFVYMFFNNDKKNGSKGFSGAIIWWKSLRLVHAFLFMLFAYFAYYENKKAWMILLVDAFIGFGAWYLHYYQSVEF
jgi:hypothetical protein